MMHTFVNVLSCMHVVPFFLRVCSYVQVSTCVHRCVCMRICVRARWWKRGRTGNGVNKPSVSLQLNSQKTLRGLTKLTWTAEEMKRRRGERWQWEGFWGGGGRRQKWRSVRRAEEGREQKRKWGQEGGRKIRRKGERRRQNKKDKAGGVTCSVLLVSDREHSVCVCVCVCVCVWRGERLTGLWCHRVTFRWQGRCNRWGRRLRMKVWVCMSSSLPVCAHVGPH